VRNLLLILSLSSILPIFAQRDEDIKNYIEQYKTIAIEEMVQFGIPASITIAQGIHESTAGKSKLALNSNNHFGIKCHNDWLGSGYKHDDDRPQECFRVYEKPEDSYRDHSVFLRSRNWYKFLFELNKTDYKSWAYGLKKAGYATNPKYADIIIGLIEKYRLADLDKADSLLERNSAPCGTFSSVNGCRVLIYNDSIPLETLCRCNGLSTSTLCLFNDINNPQTFKKGDYLFIEPKRTSCGFKDLVVNEPTSFYALSQKFGLQLSALLRFNNEKKDRQLKPNEKIFFAERTKAVPQKKTHLVTKGESLSSISKKYNLTATYVRKLNNLTSERLYVGQRLIISK